MLCIHWHEALPSTNSEAVRLAREGAPEGTVVWAEEQTAGRGRRGRTWTSPKGNLYMSAVVRPALSFAMAGRLSVACGLTITRAFQAYGMRLKWPNDLYHEGRKAGGILVETRTAPGGMLDWAVVGVGLNLASHPETDALGQPATHVPEILRDSDMGQVMQSVAAAILHAGRNVSDGVWARYAFDWPLLDLANGPIRVLEEGQTYEAIGVGLDDDGALLVRVGGTSEVGRVTAGEVSVRVMSGEAGV